MVASPVKMFLEVGKIAKVVGSRGQMVLLGRGRSMVPAPPHPPSPENCENIDLKWLHLVAVESSA